MNTKIKIGLILLFISVIATGIILELSEVARYICILAGKGFTMRWYEFLNPVAIFCIITFFTITAIFIVDGMNKKNK